MQTIGIIGAMEKEIALIRANLKNLQEEVVAGGTYLSGQLGRQQVVLTCSGIGKVNAAISAQILCDRYRVDALLNTGIAGNLADDLGLGDVVVAEQVLYHDFDPSIFAQCHPYTPVLKADGALVEQICRGRDQIGGVRYKRGVVATGDQFVSDSAVKADIIARTGADCAEMEGAAVGHTAVKNGVPFGVIRLLSDTADDEAESIYEDFADRAAELSAELLVRVIQGMA